MDKRPLVSPAQVIERILSEVSPDTTEQEIVDLIDSTIYELARKRSISRLLEVAERNQCTNMDGFSDFLAEVTNETRDEVMAKIPAIKLLSA